MAGPGRVAQALGVTREHDGLEVCGTEELQVLEGQPPEAWLHGPRVGIDYAQPGDVAAPLRFAKAGSPWDSSRKTLRPLEPEEWGPN